MAESHGNKGLVDKIWYTLSGWISCQKLYSAINPMKMGSSAVQLKILFPKSLVLNILPISLDLQYGVVQYNDLSDNREFIEFSIIDCVF